MRARDILKVNMYILALVGVLYSIHGLQQGSLGSGLAALMGLPPPAPVEVESDEELPKLAALDWCDTRVQALERPGRPNLFQDKFKWILADERPIELNFVAVEKWFGRHCRVMVEPLAESEFDQASAQPAMVVRFIKGSESALLRAADGIFRWKDQVFRSEELSAALAELDQLPRANSRP